MRYHFPRTLKAAETGERSQWAIGDALLKESTDKQVGDRGLKAVQKELETNGIEFSADYLGQLRRTAIAFPANRRHALPFKVHTAAGTPDNLDIVVKVAKQQNTKPTIWFVADALRAHRKTLEAEQRKIKEKAEAEATKAKDAELAARQKLRTAKPEERERAHREVVTATERSRTATTKAKEIRIAPKTNMPAPREEDIPVLISGLTLMTYAGDAAAALRSASKLLTKIGPDLSAVQIDALVEEALSLANGWRDFANAVRKHTANKRGHLSVVNE
jgi:hypothetical protein